MSRAVEQAFYSLNATADDMSEEGSFDRAALVRACALTLNAPMTPLQLAAACLSHAVFVGGADDSMVGDIRAAIVRLFGAAIDAELQAMLLGPNVL